MTMPSSTIYFCKTHRAWYHTKAELMDHNRLVHGNTAPAKDTLYKCTPIAPSPKEKIVDAMHRLKKMTTK